VGGEETDGRDRVAGLDEDGLVTGGAQLSDRALDDDPAPVDDRDVVAGLLDLVEHVRGEDDRASLLHEGADESAELQDARGVETVHRLVEDQQQRIGEQAASDPEALTHAQRVRLHPIARTRGQADPLERLVDPPEGVATAYGGHDLEVFASRQVTVEPRLLDNRTDAGQRLRTAPRQRQTEQPHLAGRGRGQPQQHPDQRRLAGAVRPQIAERHPTRHLQIDRIDRRAAAEALRQAPRLDHHVVPVERDFVQMSSHAPDRRPAATRSTSGQRMKFARPANDLRLSQRD
jgi:hypothetical protein